MSSASEYPPPPRNKTSKTTDLEGGVLMISGRQCLHFPSTSEYMQSTLPSLPWGCSYTPYIQSHKLKGIDGAGQAVARTA